MTCVRTSPYYPQSNGKLERYHKTLKGECIRPKTPLSLDDARRLLAEYVMHYNTVQLHSSMAYITPADKLNGREKDIFKERDRKLCNPLISLVAGRGFEPLTFGPMTRRSEVRFPS
jgi:hypothetical protein